MLGYSALCDPNLGPRNHSAHLHHNSCMPIHNLLHFWEHKQPYHQWDDVHTYNPVLWVNDKFLKLAKLTTICIKVLTKFLQPQTWISIAFHKLPGICPWIFRKVKEGNCQSRRWKPNMLLHIKEANLSAMT